jgi:hypothetical protein
MSCRTSYFNNYNCRPSYAWVPASGATGPQGPPGPPGSGTAGDDFTNFIAGETIVSKNTVFVKPDGRVYKAIALSVSGSFDIGFAISGALVGETIPIDTRHGKVLNYFSGLSAGQRYFLSESYGEITTVAPQNKDSMVYQAGIAKSATELIFYPDLLVLK